jgi:hypothetical protein
VSVTRIPSIETPAVPPGPAPPAEFHVNGDFDFSLRPRRPEAGRDGFARGVRELPLHLLLIGRPEDSVRAGGRPPQELVDELGRCGLELPAVTLLPEVRRHSRLVPFGWNRAAAELNQRYARPAQHPPLEVVRRVNGRRFAADIESELGDGEHVAGTFGSLDQLERFLQEAPRPADGWVVKAEHGNAAVANRRLRSSALIDADRRFLSAVLAEDDAVVLEPWLDRRGDLSASFRVGGDGVALQLEVHEVINTADGAFIGARFGGSEPTDQWRSAMERTAVEVARRLAVAGYTGPACTDGLLWQDRGRTRIRTLVDLNARLHVSSACLRVWREWGEQPVLLWRFFSSRRLSLPDGFEALRQALGRDAFDPDTRLGTLMTSPLWIGGSGRRQRPIKLGVLFAARSRAGTERLESSFRETFE